jgi:hypothetical protein
VGLLNKPKEAPIASIERCAEAICAKIDKFCKAALNEQDKITQLNTLKSRAKILMQEVVHNSLQSEKLQSITVPLFKFILIPYSELRYAVIDAEATKLPCYYGETNYFTSFEEAVPTRFVELVWLHQPALVTVKSIASCIHFAVIKAIHFFYVYSEIKCTICITSYRQSTRFLYESCAALLGARYSLWREMQKSGGKNLLLPQYRIYTETYHY